MTKKIIRISLQICFWLIFFLLPHFVLQNIKLKEDEVKNFLMLFGIFIPNICIVLFFYVNYYYLIPRFYVKSKHLIYFSFLLLGLMLILAPVVISASILYAEVYKIKLNFPMVYSSIIFRFVTVLFISFGLRIYSFWQLAEEHKLKAELAFLKAQINPHFLFNTINGIYSMALQKSDNTPGALLKLANIMRHVFTETSSDFVMLDKEITYISNYIDLQKLRLTPNVTVNYHFNIENLQNQIAPLIFIPFIENAFKHGVSTEEPCYISIIISDKLNTLTLEVLNKKTKLHSTQIVNYGLGIANTKQRLEHLYPFKHELTITDLDNHYTVFLKLCLQ
jgi:sensor histidine kinase YesM